jgi:hypothetical protein
MKGTNDNKAHNKHEINQKLPPKTGKEISEKQKPKPKLHFSHRPGL